MNRLEIAQKTVRELEWTLRSAKASRVISIVTLFAGEIIFIKSIPFGVAFIAIGLVGWALSLKVQHIAEKDLRIANSILKYFRLEHIRLIIGKAATPEDRKFALKAMKESGIISQEEYDKFYPD